jgi:hypothetical protein
MVYNPSICLDVAEDFEFDVEKIGSKTKDKLITQKEKKIREKYRYNLKKDFKNMVEREGDNEEQLNISSSLSEQSLDRNESSSATMVNLNYDSVTNDNLLTLKHSNHSNLTSTHIDTYNKMPIDEQSN